MSNPSPVCTINSGSTPADVAAASTVNGALANTAGANFWSIAITNTDETNTVAAVQATLSVNATAKTFSFTAPAGLGSAVQLTSTVGVLGLGLDANGKAQPSLTTTLKVNVVSSGGLRVAHTNETIEQDSNFGWDSILNQSARAPGATAGIALGHTGTTTLTQAQYALNCIVVTDTGLTGGATLAYPAGLQRMYLIDPTGVTFAGHTLTVSAGSGASTVAITTQTPTLVYVSGNKVVQV